MWDLFNKKKLKDMEIELNYIKEDRNYWHKECVFLEKSVDNLSDENQKLTEWIEKILEANGSQEIGDKIKNPFLIPVHKEISATFNYKETKTYIPQICIIKKESIK